MTVPLEAGKPKRQHGGETYHFCSRKCHDKFAAAGVPVAAGVLYPFLGILISPSFSAAAMSLSSVSVILNAPRLRSVKI